VEQSFKIGKLLKDKKTVDRDSYNLKKKEENK
jgi:hypothetical protein